MLIFKFFMSCTRVPEFPYKTNSNLSSLSSQVLFFFPKVLQFFIILLCMVSNWVKLLHQDAQKQPRCSIRDYSSGKGKGKITSAVSLYNTLIYKPQPDMFAFSAVVEQCWLTFCLEGRAIPRAFPAELLRISCSWWRCTDSSLYFCFLPRLQKQFIWLFI